MADSTVHRQHSPGIPGIYFDPYQGCLAVAWLSAGTPALRLSTLPRVVADAVRGAAVAGLSQLAIRANAVLGVDAPEQSFIRARHRGIGLGQDELPLPA